MHHYLHMAEGNYRDYLQGDSVRVKKYFYVLRPVLCCRWIESHGTMPPTEFGRTADDQLPAVLRGTLESLLERKRRGEELALGPRIPEISEFLDSEIQRLRSLLDTTPRVAVPDWDVLDAFFRHSLTEVWPHRT
jgi:predicted nucleotidyltransferase